MTLKIFYSPFKIFSQIKVNFSQKNLLGLPDYVILMLVGGSLIILLTNFQGTGDMHDAGVYFRSGLDVINGENPYPKSRWGTFGPVPFAIVVLLIPDNLQAIFIKLLSFLSLTIFVKFLLPKMSNSKLIFSLLFCTWLSAFRELIATNQMSLISLGLFTLGTRLSTTNSNDKDSWGRKTSASFFFLVSLELKPHLIFALFLFWIVLNRLKSVAFLTLILAVVSHALINASQAKILEVDFLKNLLGLGDRAASSSLGDSLSFWPILNHYIEAPGAFFIAALILPVILACYGAVLAYRGNWLQALFIAFVIPSTSIYFHYYDAVPICVIAVYCLMKITNIPLGTFTLAFLIIPKEFMNHRNQLLVVVLTLLYSLYAASKPTITELLRALLRWSAGILGVLTLHALNSSLGLSPYLLQSLIVTETVIISVLIFLYATITKRNCELRETTTR
jgi:hypothetical protein